MSYKSSMKQVWFLVTLLFLFCHVEAQGTPPPTENSYTSGPSGHQSMAILIGITSSLFFIAFILLIHPKLCQILMPRPLDDEHNWHVEPIPIILDARVSGIDKSLIISLPSFTFSSLKGSKQGLECAVCLSKFEDTEVLRLLPKCKHAFHVICVDQWLENQSSCPLCRQTVDSEDIGTYKLSSSSRSLRSDSDQLKDADVELFVQREEDHYGSSRFSVGSSFRRTLDDKHEKSIFQAHMHNFKHKIIVSGVVFSGRWSDVNSSDIISLNSDMLKSKSSNIFSSFRSNSERYMSNVLENVSSYSTNEKRMKLKEDMEWRRLFQSKVSLTNISLPSTSNIDANANNSSELLIPSDERSVSEITSFSRFSDLGVKNMIEESFSAGNNVEEERMKTWLRIARQTVEWFASKEQSKQSKQSKLPIQQSMV